MQTNKQYNKITNRSDLPEFKRGAIFRKILLIFILISLIPVAFSFFLTVSTYQDVLNNLRGSDVFTDIQLKQLRENIVAQIILLLFLLAILIVFFSILISKSITRPLSILVKGVQAVAKGNLGLKFKVKSNDEMGELADAFNKMVDKLKEQKEKEQFFTKELQEKVDELERFYRLAVGRELKMIELKKGIEKLKQETKNKSRKQTE